MVNTENFGKRIQEVMKFYHVSASGFADAMGVGRSSISHILSGRNKPSLDFVMRITEAYPEAELYWLLYGKGSFPKSEKSHEPITPKATEIIHKISENTTTPIKPEITEKDLFSQHTPEKENVAATIINDSESVRIKTTTTEKEIHQIVIFYKDGTFDAYRN
ncbi:helix-turn-helix domain-containing protein [Aquimarina sp. RZ0]|uniref:helix-turn-helix domain-containing protein n=1 Tax=Aquimarina sp. RZ0 TaxID=2607730 RepID=UPI0011F19902|nr:helix-turn-helix transcriptional regulator [Aquimarina sp. RZ0]